MMPIAPKALLFDLGGVLIDIDFRRALRVWQPLSSLDYATLEQRFRFDSEYERHERGEMEGTDYLAHVAHTLQLDATIKDVRAGWNSIYVKENTETRLLVESARVKMPCYAFTNTNATHMAAWSALFPTVVGAFDQIFASHIIGHRKPEHSAFEYVCQAIEMEPQDVLFFDDLLENVEAAIAAGLSAVLVRAPADVANALREHGIVVSEA